LFDESQLLKNAESFESTDGFLNPSSGFMPRSSSFKRCPSFASAKSGENETLFDFSTTNTVQNDLILGALPLMPERRKPQVEEEDEEKKKEKEEGEEKEDENVTEEDDGDAKKEDGEDKEDKDTEENDFDEYDEDDDDKDGETESSSSRRDRVSKKRAGKTLPKEKETPKDEVGPIQDEYGNMRQYTRDEKRIILEKYKEKKRKRSFRKVIRYECRRKFAVSRPRVGGRFVKLHK